MKPTREQRLAAGWQECWGIYDDVDGTWRSADGGPGWDRDPDQRERYSSESEAMAAIRGCSNANRIHPRRFWRRKKPKPTMGSTAQLEIDQWVRIKGNPSRDWRIAEFNHGQAVLTSEGFRPAVVHPLESIEPMPPGAVPLAIGDIVEVTNSEHPCFGQRGEVYAADNGAASVKLGERCRSLYASSVRLIRRPTPNPDPELPRCNKLSPNGAWTCSLCGPHEEHVSESKVSPDGKRVHARWRGETMTQTAPASPAEKTSPRADVEAGGARGAGVAPALQVGDVVEFSNGHAPSLIFRISSFKEYDGELWPCAEEGGGAYAPNHCRRLWRSSLADTGPLKPGDRVLVEMRLGAKQEHGLWAANLVNPSLREFGGFICVAAPRIRRLP